MSRRHKTISYALATILGTTLFIPSTIDTFAEDRSPTMEDRDHKKRTQVVHPNFTWDEPGPTSPVLHPGSATGAGMVEKPLNELDPIMEGMIEDQVMPGAVAFVARRGHIVKHEAYGYAYQYTDDDFTEVNNPIGMEKDTIFDLASISKIFTTTAAMKLYEDGYFELDDSVAQHLPEFAENGKEDITIRQLMTHTSGFPAWIPLYTQGDSREDRIQIVLEYPLSDDPGESYTYSDLNMITLGVLVERLSGQGLDEFVKENLTDPLGMEDTMYNPPESLKPRIAATEYQPYIDRGIVWGEVHDENAWSLDGVAGHAGVFSTASDLGKLAHMFLNDGRYGGKQILQENTVKLLVENQIPQFPGNDHGLGWELGQGWYMDALSEGNTLGHTGYTGTSIAINQNNDTIAILLTNRVHPTRNTVSTNVARRALARQVADSIPVSIPDGEAWFSGYGDQLNRTLTTEVDAPAGSLLSFKTWHKIETDYDFGYVEFSSDGEEWTQLESFTGSSIEWEQQSVELPEDTQYIRFNYDTDGSVNHRGWYVNEVMIETPDGNVLEPELEGWTKRGY
ncbi:serine hydrolase [Piscibacillus sp. B03]|uniref:serine hydrolase n=1 Tax=Piscibacillus sp. B03 TaxID=3457430 RepID=UPI003FCC6491